jgi:hypothetical protein
MKAEEIIPLVSGNVKINGLVFKPSVAKRFFKGDKSVVSAIRYAKKNHDNESNRVILKAIQELCIAIRSSKILEKLV